MLGLFNRTKPADFPAIEDPSPRGVSIKAARSAVNESIKYLSLALGDVGIDCTSLVGKSNISASDVSEKLDRALAYEDGGDRFTLKLGKTLDQSAYNLGPHYRYREIHLIISDLERLQSGHGDARRALSLQHAPHALLQCRLLDHFLVRVPGVELLVAVEDWETLKAERQLSGRAITALTDRLPSGLARGIDLDALRREWTCWPHVLTEHVAVQTLHG